jgi:uncharacterized membrane protein
MGELVFAMMTDRTPLLPVYIDATLTPNRSLSPGAFTLFMCAVAVVSFLSGLAFLQMGAWPVFGFFGLDVLLVWLAFRWHRGRTPEQTRVRITAESVELHHRDKRGRETSAQLPSAFARIELDEPVSAYSWLRIEHGRTAFIIGRFLTPKERSSLAAALRLALKRARAERHPA